MTVTPPPVAPPSSQQAAAPKKTSGLAVAALILGICGIVPCLGVLLGLIGIVLGIVALAKNAGGRGFAIAGIVAGVGGIVIVQVLLLVPALKRSSIRALCGGNLNGIAKGIAIYGTEHEDAFPPNLEVLITEGTVSWKMLQCPRVEWKMPRAQSAEENRRRDYFYLAPSGKQAQVAEDAIIVCDYRGNHDDGRNVLYVPWGRGDPWKKPPPKNVRKLTEVEFQAELAKPVNAAFAAALRKAEGERQRGN